MARIVNGQGRSPLQARVVLAGFVLLLFVLIQLRNNQLGKLKQPESELGVVETDDLVLSIPRKDSYRNNAVEKGDETVTIQPPSFSAKTHASSIKMTCNRDASNEELDMIRELKDFIARGILKPRAPSSGVFFSLSTLATLKALQVQVASMKENAPSLVKSFIIFCVGEEMCAECRKMHSICVADKHMARILGSNAGANSMGHGNAKDGVSKLYVDIIWRKPELMRIAFVSGAREVGVVDSDGAWFAKPPNDFGPYPIVSSEFTEPSQYSVSPSRCQYAPLHREAPLVLNSGTVVLRKDALGLALLDDWIASRTLRKEGLCGTETATVSRTNVMLDQDGLNMVACMQGKVYSGKVQGMSFNQVLLNSVHFEARMVPTFSICEPWFFHSTNCGDNLIKHTCMEKNLQRRRDQCNRITEIN